MTGAKHRAPAGQNWPVGIFLVLGTLLSVSISVNAVLYVYMTWDLVPN